MGDKEYTVILEQPLIRVDFERMTVGDFARLAANGQYGYTLMVKCIVDDLDSIPFDYAPAIAQAFMTELGQFLKEIMTTHELTKAIPNVTQ